MTESTITRAASRCFIAFALALPAAAPTQAQAQFVQRINAGPNAAEELLYGFALASHGPRVAVGELYGLAGGSPVVVGGAVEIWRLQGNTMVREQRLLSPAPGTGHQFGGAVAMTDDRLAVAERGASAADSRVHVYQRQGQSWQLDDTLLPPTIPAGSQATAVVLTGDWLLMGVTTGSGDSGTAPGRVFAWQREQGDWVMRQELTPLDSSPGDAFGLRMAAPARVSAGASRVAIGAPFRNQGRGAVYVFTLVGTTWQQEQRLAPADVAPGEHFGFGVAINGDLVVGGTFIDSTMLGWAGRIALWRRSGSGDFPWQPDNLFGGMNAQPGDRYGQAVALPTPRDVVIGSPEFDVTPSIGPVLENAGASAAHARRLRGVNCATLWPHTGNPGNPTALAQAGSWFGYTAAADRLIAISAPLGTFAGATRAGFVDVLIHDRLLDSDFDCSH